MLEPVIEGGTVAILVVLAEMGVETNDDADDTMDELAGPMEVVVAMLDIVMEPAIDPAMEEGRAVPEVVFDITGVDAKEDPVEAGGRALIDEELELGVAIEDIPEPFDVNGEDDCMLEPILEPMSKLDGGAVVVLAELEADINEEPMEVVREPILDPMLRLGGGVAVVELAELEADINEEPMELVREPMLDPMLRLGGGVAVVELTAGDVVMNEEPIELVREPVLDPMLRLGGGVAVVELTAGDVVMNEEPIELVIEAMLEPLLELDGGTETVEFAAPEVDVNEEPMELPEDAMLEPMLRLDAPGEVDETGIDDPIEEAGLDVIEDPEAGVVVLATLLVVRDEAIELTGDEDLVLALTKDEPVGAGVTAVVLMLLGVEVDMNEEPTELVEIEEPGKVFPVDDPLGEETGIDEFAALVELDVAAKDDPAGVVERDTIELPLDMDEPAGFDVMVELVVPLGNEEDGLLVLPMVEPAGDDANDEPVVLVGDDAELESELAIEEPGDEDAKDEAVVLVEDDRGLETGLVMEPTGEDGKDEAVAPVEDGLEAGLVMEELTRVDMKDDPSGLLLDDEELESGFVIEDPADVEMVEEPDDPELTEDDDATEVTEDPVEDDIAGLEAAGAETVVGPEVGEVEETLMGWLEVVVDMVVSRVVVSFGQLQGAFTGPQYIAFKKHRLSAKFCCGRISFSNNSPTACNCLICKDLHPSRSPPASWQRG
ncbi:hypothetical protein KC353_g16786 [Hortaea werneckii]|nr:hypothetical protein KC353_g16786 [Hortaea werneckii]